MSGPRSARLTAYGHSWVGGAGATDPSRGFVDVAAHALGLVPDSRGVGGSHSPDTAELVCREPPPASELCVVMTGLNDARLHGLSQRAVEAYAAALEMIFSALARANPAVITLIVEQPPLVDYSFHEPHNRGSNEVLVAYNRQLRAVASRFPVHVVTVTDWNATTMLDEDTVHPNDRGHAAVAAAVVAVAKRTVQ